MSVPLFKRANNRITKQKEKLQKNIQKKNVQSEKEKKQKKNMDLCNKILSKAPLSWLDVQKQLLTAMQSRAGAGGGAGSVSTALQYAATSVSLMNASSVNANSSALPINKTFVKQCTDFLIKHIKSMRKTGQTPTIWALDRDWIILKQNKKKS